MDLSAVFRSFSGGASLVRRRKPRSPFPGVVSDEKQIASLDRLPRRRAAIDMVPLTIVGTDSRAGISSSTAANSRGTADTRRYAHYHLHTAAAAARTTAHCPPAP